MNENIEVTHKWSIFIQTFFYSTDEEHEDIYEHIDVTNNHTSTPANPVPLERNLKHAPTPKYTEVNKQPNKLTESPHLTIDRTTRYIRPANSINELMERRDISNSLHDALNRLKIENLAERDSIDEEGTEDILLRSKPFKQFSSNSQRGSSKVLCSMVSVSWTSFKWENFCEFHFFFFKSLTRTLIKIIYQRQKNWTRKILFVFRRGM